MQIEYTDPIGGNKHLIVPFTVKMAAKSEVADGNSKKGMSLFKQLPWVEQVEGIKKYLSNPRYPTACCPECVTASKKKDFRDILKNYMVDDSTGQLFHLHKVKKLSNSQWASE